MDADPTTGWADIERRYDGYSLHDFLRERGWSDAAIEYYAVLNFLESDMHHAFTEILREDLGGAYTDMQTIAGGMDALPRAFFGELQDEVRLGAEVYAIAQDPDGVTVHYKTEATRGSVRPTSWCARSRSRCSASSRSRPT